MFFCFFLPLRNQPLCEGLRSVMLWFSISTKSQRDGEFKNHVLLTHVALKVTVKFQWGILGSFLGLDWWDFRCSKQERIRHESHHSGAITETPFDLSKLLYNRAAPTQALSVSWLIRHVLWTLRVCTHHFWWTADLKTLLVGIKMLDISLGWESLVDFSTFMMIIYSRKPMSTSG